MARAGFTAISSGKIKFGKDGRWYCDGEVIPNRAIAQLYSRTLRMLPDGRARLELGEDKADVLIEDTPWVVTAVEGDPGAGQTFPCWRSASYSTTATAVARLRLRT